MVVSAPSDNGGSGTEIQEIVKGCHEPPKDG